MADCRLEADGLYGTSDDYYEAQAFEEMAKISPHTDADADNNVDLLDANNTLDDFSVADFVDFIQAWQMSGQSMGAQCQDLDMLTYHGGK